MIALGDLCDVRHGSKLDLNKMRLLALADGGIRFVGRSSESNGVTASIARVEGLQPFESGLITVALGGSRLLASFVQEEPFYTAQNVAVLKPKQEMSLAEKLYLCLCIKHNRPRYSAFGREANRTVRHILVPRPEDFPDFVREAKLDSFENHSAPAVAGDSVALFPLQSGARLAPLDALFQIRQGHSLERNALTAVAPPAGVNFVGRANGNNGVTARVAIPPGVTPGAAGELTVALNGQGGVLSTFVQPEPFVCGFHVAILSARDPAMSLSEKLWWCACIYANRYRFSFGRQANRTLGGIMVPDMQTAAHRAAIRRFVESLPFSSRL